MFEAFNSQSKTIGELLSGNTRAKIEVPQFQRGYSWEKKHVEAFWEDITIFQNESAAAGGPEKYFLGPIVVMPESKEKINLLDGQQRLATATMLFSVLRDVARELNIQGGADFARDVQRDFIAKEDAGYSLVMGELDKEYFQETIQADPPTTKSQTTKSHRNIKKAQTFLLSAVRAKIAALNATLALDVLKKLRQTLRSDLVMACIPVASERDAFRIFETLNDRGLRLSVPDLLLNHLMREAMPETDRSQIRDYWNEMLEQMGRRDINRFLRHMWVSKYGDLKSKDLFTALKEHLKANSIGSLYFARECATACEKYVQLLDADDEHLGAAASHVRSLLRQMDVQSALPLLLSAYELFEPADFEKVAMWLLVFVMRYSVVMNLDSSGLETVFFQLAREIRSRMTAATALKSCLAHVKDTLTKNAPSDDQVRLAVTDLVLSPDEAKYVLGRLAVFMQTKTKEVKIDEANLEHVFPKNPSDEWDKPEALEPYLWHIGNLTILGERLNRTAANKGFTTKRSHYEKKSELKMAQQIAEDYTTWDAATIKARASKLAPMIIEVWSFNNPSRV